MVIYQMLSCFCKFSWRERNIDVSNIGVLLGGNIRTYRKAAKLTQEQMAEKAELDPKYISEVECGAVNISMDSLVRISKALKIPLSDLTMGI